MTTPSYFRLRHVRGQLTAALAIAAFVATVGASTPAAPAKQTAELPPAIAAYASSLSELLAARGRQSIEPVFAQGMQAGPSLVAVLPDLGEADYQKAQREMTGFIVERHEVIFVRPSVDYFKQLARKKGSKADREFFEVYDRTEPDGNGPFPAYVMQQTDEAGCTRFDGKLFTDLYRRWMTFRTGFPDDYGTEAQGEIDSIESELLSGICSCDDASKTAAGLQAFADAEPDLPITPKIKKRIAQIREGKSNFRFKCIAG